MGRSLLLSDYKLSLCETGQHAFSVATKKSNDTVIKVQTKLVMQRHADRESTRMYETIDYNKLVYSLYRSYPVQCI